MDIWGDTKVDFLGKRKFLLPLSAIIVVIGLIAAAAIPLGKARLGIDFSGGIAIQYRFQKPVAIEQMRKVLEDGGFDDAELQEFAEPDKLLVRLKSTDKNVQEVAVSVGEVFAKALPDNPHTVDSTTAIGPAVGKKLQQDALWAVGISLLGILIYVAWRFEFRFGVAAVAATFHDVLFVLGFLFITGTEITLLIITALLTLAGYSLTDTVVVFDRIRENMHKKTREDFVALVNRSINEVLRRTVVTSLTTILAVLALLVVGGEVIFDFALTLFVGILVGTYSSIFIASPLLLLWKEKKPKRKAPEPADGVKLGM